MARELPRVPDPLAAEPTGRPRENQPQSSPGQIPGSRAAEKTSPAEEMMFSHTRKYSSRPGRYFRASRRPITGRSRSQRDAVSVMGPWYREETWVKHCAWIKHHLWATRRTKAWTSRGKRRGWDELGAWDWHMRCDVCGR